MQMRKRQESNINTTENHKTEKINNKKGRRKQKINKIIRKQLANEYNNNFECKGFKFPT